MLVFQEDCFELGEKKIFKMYGSYWQLKIKIADYLMKMYGDYIPDPAKVKNICCIQGINIISPIPL